MSFRGRQVYDDMRRRLAEAQRDVAAATNSSVQLRTRVADLVAERGTAMVELAQSLLPELEENAIDRTFQGVRNELHTLREQRDQRIEQLRRAIASALDQRDQHELSLEELDARVETAATKVDTIESDVAAQLEQDTRFCQLSNEAAHAEERLERDEERAAEIDREAKDKLPSYERCKLFTYLCDREFGTPSYRSRGLTARLDRWVARIVHWEENRRGYDFLRITPELVGQEVARRSEEFDALMEQVEAIRDSAAAAAGLPMAQATLDDLEAERAGIATALEESVERLARATDELEDIQRGQGRFYAEAIARFRDFLTDKRTSSLARRAARTDSPADDRLVDEIRDIDERLEELEHDFEDRERDRQRSERKVRELEAVMRRYRRRGFERRPSQFSARDPRRHTDDFMRGEIDGEELWSRFEHSQSNPLAGALGSFAQGVGEVLSHPATRVLARAMGNVVGGALGGAAHRGVGRRGGFGTSIPEVKRGGSGQGPGHGGFSIGDSF